MDIDAQAYDQASDAHFRDAGHLVDRIISEKGNAFDLVLDVGCGSGRATQLLDSRLSCGKIVAVDIDAKAIDFAANRYASPRINYQTQDIALPWEELDSSIQQLEGKVDMIFSNRALHWIENKNQAVANFYRLLKPGTGAFYANLTTLWEVFADLGLEEKAQFDKLLPIPSEAEQIEQLKSLFGKNQFKVNNVESTVQQQLYQSDDFKSVMLPYFQNLTKKYMAEKDQTKRDQILSGGLLEEMRSAFLRLYTREVNKTEALNQFELTYGRIGLVAHK